MSNKNNLIIVYEDGTEEPNTHESILTSKRNNFFGWQCNAGLDYISIKGTGDVYAGDCKVKHLGNIYSSFSLPDETVTCKFTSCNCAGDVQTPKKKLNNSSI